MPDTPPNLLKENVPGPRLAILAEAFFLANLMVIPVIGFLAIVFLWLRYRTHPSPIVRNHLQQALFASLWGGIILTGVVGLIFTLGGFNQPVSWLIAILYFVCIHATLILLGIIGLNRAILAKTWRYPLIGPKLEDVQ